MLLILNLILLDISLLIIRPVAHYDTVPFSHMGLTGIGLLHNAYDTSCGPTLFSSAALRRVALLPVYLEVLSVNYIKIVSKLKFFVFVSTGNFDEIKIDFEPLGSFLRLRSYFKLFSFIFIT